MLHLKVLALFLSVVAASRLKLRVERIGLSNKSLDGAGDSQMVSESQAGGSVLVVCLGQKLRPDGGVPVSLQNRIDHAVALMRKRNSLLYVSGGDTANVGVPEGDVMLGLFREAGVDSARILVDRNAKNTIENAIIAMPYIKLHGIKKVLLVTNEFHIPRAMFVFKCALRRYGLDPSILKAEGVPSGLDGGPLRPKADRPEDMALWNYQEHILIEQYLMKNRMKSWIEETYQSPVLDEDVEAALRELEIAARRGPMKKHGDCFGGCTLS